MSYWRRCLPFTVFILFLTACAPRGDAPVTGAQAAELPAAAPVAGSHDPPKTCPVTAPTDPAFTPPEPYPAQAPEGQFWHGTHALWTMLPQNGAWSALPLDPEGYVQKVFWWSESYFWADNPQPDLVVSGQRLDETAPPLKVSRTTNAFAEDIQSAMLVGVGFPTQGCWEITGQYGKAELSFVAWVGP